MDQILTRVTSAVGSLHVILKLNVLMTIKGAIPDIFRVILVDQDFFYLTVICKNLHETNKNLFSLSISWLVAWSSPNRSHVWPCPFVFVVRLGIDGVIKQHKKFVADD